MYTVITKGNEVSQHISIDSIERSVEGPFLAIGNCNGTKVAFTEDNPITWPTDATSGMQAIVDVKAGTLRFGYDGWPRSQTEFVVSNYVEPVTSAPHIFDVINYWPQQDRQCLGTKELPEGWMWQWAGNDWVLSNGTIRLVRDDWFKHKFGDAEPAKQFEPFVSVEDSAPVHILDYLSSWPNPAHVAILQGEIFDDWRWWQEQGGGHWILRNDKEGVEFHEGHWLNYHENKKKHAAAQPSQQQVTAASMLTAALGHMEDRAKTYDAPGGERSMGKTVAAFNIITGHTLTEEAGWLFMEILKQVRSQQGDYRADNYEDMVAYAALRGECAARERGNQS